MRKKTGHQPLEDDNDKDGRERIVRREERVQLVPVSFSNSSRQRDWWWERVSGF
jgi:hypothetical protein